MAKLRLVNHFAFDRWQKDESCHLLLEYEDFVSHRRNVGARVVDHVVIALVVAAKLLGPVVPVRNQMSLRATRNREAHLSLGGCALDLLMTLLGLFLFVALGVLGRADLAALGVDARATLSFALDYFACRFGRHIYY